MSNLGPQFDSAQRHHDNLMPEPDPPEPKGAVDCVCGEQPMFEFTPFADLAFRVMCPKCTHGGKAKGSAADAVEAWNDHIAELRKEDA